MDQDGGKIVSVRDLGLKPGRIICTICKRDGVTKAAVPNTTSEVSAYPTSCHLQTQVCARMNYVTDFDSSRLCVIAVSAFTCFWCLPFMANLPRWAIHSCSQCDVTLCKFVVRKSYDDVRRELASYVTRRLDEQTNPMTDKEHETNARDLEVKETSMVYSPAHRTTVPSPLDPPDSPSTSIRPPASPPAPRHIIKLHPTPDRTGTWTVTSSDPSQHTYTITVHHITKWEEDRTIQSDWDRAPYPRGPTTFIMIRESPGGATMASASGTIDDRAGSWSAAIKTGSHSFTFCVPEHRDAGASSWQVATSEGTLFWAEDGWTRVLVDAYGRFCARLRGHRSTKLTLDARLRPAAVDQIVAVAVALVVQQQRSDCWSMRNPS